MAATDDWLNIMAEEVVEINRANGWNVLTPDDWSDVHRMGTACALIHTEVSEAMEAVRHGDKDNFAEELADTLIRVLDTAGGLEIDLDAVVRAKLEKNRGRGFRHGGKKV